MGRVIVVVVVVVAAAVVAVVVVTTTTTTSRQKTLDLDLFLALGFLSRAFWCCNNVEAGRSEVY